MYWYIAKQTKKNTWSTNDDEISEIVLHHLRSIQQWLNSALRDPDSSNSCLTAGLFAGKIDALVTQNPAVYFKHEAAIEDVNKMLNAVVEKSMKLKGVGP